MNWKQNYRNFKKAKFVYDHLKHFNEPIIGENAGQISTLDSFFENELGEPNKIKLYTFLWEEILNKFYPRPKKNDFDKNTYNEFLKENFEESFKEIDTFEFIGFDRSKNKCDRLRKISKESKKNSCLKTKKRPNLGIIKTTGSNPSKIEESFKNSSKSQNYSEIWNESIALGPSYKDSKLKLQPCFGISEKQNPKIIKIDELALKTKKLGKKFSINQNLRPTQLTMPKIPWYSVPPSQINDNKKEELNLLLEQITYRKMIPTVLSKIAKNIALEEKMAIIESQNRINKYISEIKPKFEENYRKTKTKCEFSTLYPLKDYSQNIFLSDWFILCYLYQKLIDQTIDQLLQSIDEYRSDPNEIYLKFESEICSSKFVILKNDFLYDFVQIFIRPQKIKLEEDKTQHCHHCRRYYNENDIIICQRNKKKNQNTCEYNKKYPGRFGNISQNRNLEKEKILKEIEFSETEIKLYARVKKILKKKETGFKREKSSRIANNLNRKSNLSGKKAKNEDNQKYNNKKSKFCIKPTKNKQKSSEILNFRILIQDSRSKNPCNRKYCKNCLKKFYDMTGDYQKFVCPFCCQGCFCKRCTTQKLIQKSIGACEEICRKLNIECYSFAESILLLFENHQKRVPIRSKLKMSQHKTLFDQCFDLNANFNMEWILIALQQLDTKRSVLWDLNYICNPNSNK